MARNIQQIMTYKLDRTGDTIHTSRSSFGTLEKAVENANMFIYRTESWVDTTVISVKIINKETKEVLWTYEAEDDEEVKVGDKVEINGTEYTVKATENYGFFVKGISHIILWSDKYAVR